jgi:uncharacterized protein (DUF1501 family)
MSILTRRSLGLGALGAALATLTAGAHASLGRRFLFVHAEGGWDPLCVFAPLFGATAIDMEPDSAPLSVGGFSLVARPGRPHVSSFFERWGAKTLLLNGLSTRSVNHETCQAVALTGAGGDTRADWATLIAAHAAERYALPHLVMNGPSFAGPHAVVVSHAEGQLEEAVHGTIALSADTPLAPPSDAARARVDEYLAGRGADVEASRHALSRRYAHALSRARALTDARELVHFAPAYDFRARTQNALQLLANDVTRCASVATDGDWDTHIDNEEQSALFDDLFADLSALLDELAVTATASGGTLADDTVVVVLSEMARTPAYNATGGRDHWPYTSALVIGNGITGGRTVGAFDDHYVGVGIDPISAELDPARPGIDAGALGATLLALADVDPAEHLINPEILSGVLS